MTKLLLLLVEDDELLSKMYQQKLALAGFNVDVAHDGLEGYEKMKLDKPDAVLMDIMMPKMNGLEVLAKVKTDPLTQTIPVVMLTNLSGSNDIHKALDLGALGYIVKSELTPAEVIVKLKQLLASKIPEKGIAS